MIFFIAPRTPTRHGNSAILAPLLAVLAALLGLLPVPAVRADTTVPITGIGTSIMGAFAINSHADRVTYSAPVDVVINGLDAVEIRGTVSGVGWGGAGIVARAANSHYHYDIPFVARWRKHGPNDHLVFFNHGGGPSVIAAVLREKQSPGANSARSAELNGDLLVGAPWLLNGAAYISINRRGLRNDGTFSATYQPPMPPLSASEVAAIEGQLAAAPGGPAFHQPGIAAGAAVPLVPTDDAPTCRDIARALEQVVAGILKKPFRTRIGIGTSSGCRLFAALNFGRSVIGGTSVRTGGNNIVPYDGTSARIFDAYIFNGFTYVAGVAQAEPALPLSVPVVFVQGQGDERYQQHVAMAYELWQKGVVLDGSVWLYEIKNLTHVTRDSVADTTKPSNGDRLGCFMGAGIRNLQAFLEHGKALPPSRMAGRIVGGALRFDQADGSTSNIAPVLNDPRIDSYVVDANLTPRTIGSVETTHWLAVTSALPHIGDAITPPTVACRLGGYKLLFFGSQRVPVVPANLSATFSGFESYRDCVCQTVRCLVANRLYDDRVESAYETAELCADVVPASDVQPRAAMRPNLYQSSGIAALLTDASLT